MTDKKDVINLVESLLEEDGAYGSNLSLLSCAVNSSGAVRGVFKDAWNNRIFSFQLDKTELSYRPRLSTNTLETLDSAGRIFDRFSDGYQSTIKPVERKDTLTKRIKKPRCGYDNYNCGFACIDIKKNCRIELDSLSKERLSKLKVISKNLVKNVGKDDADYLEVLQIIERIKSRSVKQETIKLSNSEFRIVGDADVRKKLKQWTDAYKRISKLNELNDIEGVAGIQSYIDYLEREKAKEQANIVNLELKVKSFDYRQSVIDNNEKYKEFTPAIYRTEKYILQFAEDRKNRDIESIAESQNKIKLANDEIAEKERQIKTLKKREAQQDKNTPQIDRERLSAATSIVEIVLSMKSEKDVEFGGIVDSEGNLQAAYTYTHTSSGHYIDYLASAPWNCLPDHPNKKTGAGASAIEGLIREALLKKKKGTIELIALPNAVPFYKKIGFTTKDDITGLPSMKLDAISARKFIEQQDLKKINKQDSRQNLNLLTELERLEDEALGLFSVPSSKLNLVRQRGKL